MKVSKKSKRKLKGMTLMEMIISIAVFAVLGVILITLCTTVNTTVKSTNNLKKKVAEQSPYAVSGQSIYGYDDDGAGTLTPKTFDSTPVDIVITVSGTGSYYKLKDPNDFTQGFEATPSTYNNPSETITGDKFDTEKLYTEGMTATEVQAYEDSINGELNLKFVSIP